MDSLKTLEELNISVFLDGADINDIRTFNNYPQIKGFTSNPTLMVAAGISNYSDFIRESLKAVNNKPISFEVVADDLEEMYEQALRISNFGNNIYIKIPVTNTKGISTNEVIEALSNKDIKINVTAITHLTQIEKIISSVNPKNEVILSIFAGRIADTGVDPEEIFNQLKNISYSQYFKTLWASPREIYNLYQANKCGADIITITKELLLKTRLYKKNLHEYSLDTVKMFYNDGKKNKLDI